MEYRLEVLKEKKLVGKCLKVSLLGNKTAELWRSFMPRRKEILNNIGTELYSMQIYPPQYFTHFSIKNEFEKWATIEVEDFNNVPNGMETYILKGGLYAVFKYKGLAGDSSPFQYILGTWLPNSDFVLDDRPHFEILGEKYSNTSPDSEEEIWIPVREKI